MQPRRLAALAMVVLLALPVGPGGAAATDDDRPAVGGPAQQATDCDFPRLYDRVVPSVVAVRVSNATGDFAQAAGWVVRRNDSAASLVTNWHVVADAVGGVGNATGIDVQFSGGEWRTAVVVGTDPVTDLAVLRVRDPPEDAQPLSLATAAPDEGQSLAILGSPLWLEGSIARGIVSAVNRSVRYGVNLSVPGGTVVSNVTLVEAIQFDAAAPGGTSGGPVVNCAGRVVGVQAASARFEDVNFAIPASTVRTVVPALVETGGYRHPALGVRTLTLSPTLARVNDAPVTRGVLVTGVDAGGPAAGLLQPSTAIDRRTGLPVGGDVVVAIDGTRVESENDLLSYLFAETRPGETVAVTVLRDGDRRTVNVTLGVRNPAGNVTVVGGEAGNVTVGG